MTLTVEELIKELETITNKNKPVYFFINHEWLEVGFDSTSVELDDRVLLGDDIPPEKYETDYKYER